MPFVVAFFIVFALLALYLVVQARRAGPRQLGELDLARAVTLAGATASDPGNGWSLLGSKTTAEGLNLKFDHDDDPQAEASFLIDPAMTREGNTLAHRVTVRLSDEFETHHVHTRGHVFRVRLRGTGSVVGKEVLIQMHVMSDGTPWGGRVEHDDDTDAAVGGWIEFDAVEILQVGGR
jgi:hypothetical protein